MWKYVPFINLVILVRVITRNGGLSPSGMLHITPWLVKTIALEPLRWIELLVYERKINRHRVNRQPIFILGHYRSGTTYLQRLFMQDDRLGYMSIFQSALPEIMLCFEKLLTPVLQFFCNVFKVKNPFHRIPFTWKFPGEDDVGMIAMLNAAAAQWGILFPRSMPYYFNKRNERWKKDYVYLLKKISLQNDGRRLVLKSPPNTARIKELLELFPQASFVFIHRNPLDIYASTKRFWQVITKHYVLGKSNKADIPKMILTHYKTMMNRYLQYKELVPEGQLAEVAYNDLVQDPLGTMRSVYKQLRLPGIGHCIDDMQNFIHEQRSYRRLDHKLSKEETAMVQDKLGKLANQWT
jgi:omega-hydroxy-beta-dihydromenaquinone-9 sulfotransferase